jgi:hypothetical protein
MRTTATSSPPPILANLPRRSPLLCGSSKDASAPATLRRSEPLLRLNALSAIWTAPASSSLNFNRRHSARGWIVRDRRAQVGASIDAPYGGSAISALRRVLPYPVCRDVGRHHRLANRSRNFRHLFSMTDDHAEPRSESRVACSGREQPADVSLHSASGRSCRHGKPAKAYKRARR